MSLLGRLSARIVRVSLRSPCAASAQPLAAAACARHLQPCVRGTSLAAPVAHMSLWKSPMVQEWIEKQADEKPWHWKPRPWGEAPGKHRTSMCSPMFSRRKQKLLLKQAIHAGEIKLEPTVMPDISGVFKGHARERRRPNRQAEIEAKMAEMPALVAAYKAERLERRRAAKRDRYFKSH